MTTDWRHSYAIICLERITVTDGLAVHAGGEGAPELSESLLNFSINAAALALLSWLFSRDVAAAQRDSKVVEREEALGRLLVRASLPSTH